MPVARGQWAELLAPGLNMHTFMAYQRHPEMYRRIVNVKPSKRAFEDDFRIGGLGPLVQKGELATTILDEPIKVGGKRITNYTFALAVPISKEMRDDAQYSEILELAGFLGLSSYWTLELYGHDVYNNAFTTAKYTTRDGQALCSLTHAIEGLGTTYANRPTPDVDLSEASLEAAILNYELMINERGMPILAQPRTLLVHPSNRMLAKRLLNSAGMPQVTGGTNVNDINPLFDEGLTPFSDPWLTDSDAWFLIGEPSQLGVMFYLREMPDTKTWDDDNADATFHKIRQRHGVGATDWRNVYGTAGI